jgi:hypothetical protein
MKTQTETKISSLFIEGRAWFDKTYGNTYHSVRVWANGEVIGQVGMTYGYEDHYKQTALEFLKRFGLVSEDISQIWKLRYEGVNVYSVLTYGKKSELFKDLTVDENFSNLLQIEKIKKGN